METEIIQQAFWPMFFLWLATFIISDYFRARLPEQTPSGIGDFNIPTATEGRYVPLVFGTMQIGGPNVIWYGDFSYEEITVSTGVIFKDDETVGYKYFMGMQLGIMRGECAGIRRIWIGDEVVWDFDVQGGGTLGTVCDVSNDELFGGSKKGGGFIGRFRLFNGTQTQGQSSYLSLAKHGITNLPAYRGYTHIVLTNLAEDAGAEIGESNTLRQIKFELQTFDTTANGGLGDSLALGNDHHFIGDDLNPIVLAWDIFTNTDWGRALSVSDLNMANFVTAAETLWTEALGFSMVQDTPTDSAALLDLIEQHVDGYIGPNPITGQIEIVLARQDYTLASEFQADETNVISVSKFSRGENNQTFNEVRVQYLDRGKEYGDTYAPAQDLANLAIQGRPRSKTNRMPGVHSAAAANKIAWRDLRGAARPVAQANVEIDRTAWALRPGMIISLTDEQVGVTDVPMRIIAIRQGDPVNATMVLDCVEDIFGVEETGFSDPPPSEFVPPTLDVLPLEPAEGFVIDAVHRMIREAFFGGAIASQNGPRVMTAVRSGSGGAMTEYEIATDSPKGGISPAFGSDGFVSSGKMTMGVLRDNEDGWLSGNGTKTMQVDPPGSPFAVGSLDALIGEHFPGGFGQMGGLCIINPGAANQEYILTTEIVDDLGGIRLEGVFRGALDSNQEEHVAGETIWFIWTGGLGMGITQFAAGQTFETKLLPRSSTDAIEVTDSPEPISQADSTFTNPDLFSLPYNFFQASFNGSIFPTGNVDFDNVIDGGGGPDLVGILNTLSIKPYFSSSNILNQVQGLFENGFPMGPGDFSLADYRISWWLFDLDATPAPVRGVDEILSAADQTVTQQTYPSNLLKTDISPTPEVNSFNARFEAVVDFSPYGGAPRDANNDLVFDFTAIGLFVVPRDAIFFQLVTEGEIGSRRYRDVSDSNFDMVVMGNADTELIGSPIMNGLNTAVARINDTPDSTNSEIFAIADVLHPKSGRNFDMNQDWTIEMTLQWTTVPFSTGQWCICTQQNSGVIQNGESEYYNAGTWWGIFYDNNNDRFQFQYATSVGGAFSIANLQDAGEFSPVAGQTYRFMFTRKDLGDGNFQMAVFIDGVKTATPQTVTAFTVVDYTTAVSPVPDDLFMTFARGQTFRNIAHSTILGLQARIDAVRIVLGFALELIDYTPSTAEFPVKNTLSLLVSTNVDGDDSVNPLITCDGIESAINVGASNGITMQPSPFPASPEELYPCWDCTGINSLTPANTGAPYLSAFEGGDREISMNFNRLDFQMEAWVRYRTLPVDVTNSDGAAIIGKYNRPSGTTVDWAFVMDKEHRLFFNYWDGGLISSPSRTLTEDTGSPPVLSPIGSESPERLETDRWYHFACARNGDAMSIWKDGVRVAHDPAFFSGSPPNGPIPNSDSNPIGIGRYYDASVDDRVRCLDGWITDVRIILEDVTYSGASITVPTEPFATKRGTVLPNNKGTWRDNASFLANWDDLGLSPLEQATDYGNLGFGITFVNNATLDTSIQKYGSACLDVRQGSPVQDGDNVCSIAENNVFDFEHRDVTFETWVRFNSLPASGETATFIGKWNRNQENTWRIGWDFTDGWFWECASGGTTTITRVSSGSNSPEPALNTWIHVRGTRRNDWAKIFVDGVQLGEVINSRRPPTGENEPTLFGAALFGATREDFFDGWLDDSLICIGHAKDDNQEFTPVQNMLSHTLFQLGYGNDGFNYAIPVDDSKSDLSTDVVSIMEYRSFPFMAREGGEPVQLNWINGGTQRVEFTGSSGLDMGTADFTIEMWMMWHNQNHQTSTNECLLAHWNSSGNNRNWAIQYEGNPLGPVIGSPNLNDRTLKFYWYPDGTLGQSLSFQWIESPDLFRWFHIAFVREGGQLRLYIDGVRKEFEIHFREGASPEYQPAIASPNGTEFPNASPEAMFDPGASADLTIGSLVSTTNPADASFDGVRILNLALYDADFTPDIKWPRI